MLKWAVNQPRVSYLEAQPDRDAAGGHVISSYSDFQPTATPTPIAASRTKLNLNANAKRHSLLHIQMQAGGKENQLTSTLTSTPLPAASAAAAAAAAAAPRCTPLLRDLSNILSPLHTPPLKRTAYACTLPTFEAEYSPGQRDNKDQADSQRDTQDNRIIPGALLALRGMGIPDSYFEKPRYLQPAASSAAAAAPPPPSAAPVSDQATLSSSQMGDVTLERMIDAILESTRKPPAAALRPRSRALPHPHPHAHSRSRSRSRLRHISRSHARPAPLPLVSTSHSPTYRPAFDPASDLREYWQPPTHPDAYEEREVRSPQVGSGEASLSLVGKRRSLQQLRRQRVVRRKRKITTKISSSVRHSAQKLLAAAARSAHKLPHPHAHSRAPGQRHISPDSGHNSTSDCELEMEMELELQLEEEARLAPFADCVLEAATKRRLSFSFHEEHFVEQ
ncbi:uncharacterized protein LOC111604690 [Drosophila hydei]|uniref:Uncharacterized protein LOC111604690 n=1 Tax=Drosophila hydei TaxID=7224 RepID=A0A6J1MHP7_DROHY|nr:uncharacterized protein LOC111604690 [Drosophila hydei]